MLSKLILVAAPLILLLQTTMVHSASPHLHYTCPASLPGTVSDQLYLPVVRLTKGKSFTFTCARACGSRPQWLIRIPKYKEDIYFPERRKFLSPKLPPHMTIALQDNNKCYHCPFIGQSTMSHTLELRNIHKDLNGSKIYCGQITAYYTSFSDDPVTLMVYSPEKRFDKPFLKHPRTNNLLSKQKVVARNTGFFTAQINTLIGSVIATSIIAILIMYNNMKSRLSHVQINPIGVTFIGTECTTTIRNSEQTVHWPEAGLKLNIPRGVVPPGKESIFCCQQAIAGPFVVPPGQTLASTIYHVIVTPPLQGEIELTITHAAKLTTYDDCASMQFLRAHHYPVKNDQGNIEYHFREVNDRPSTFTAGSRDATICLREFSFWCCSTSKSRTLDYLVKLAIPREPLVPTPHAIYAVSLATPTLDKFFNDLLQKEYPLEQFKCTDGRQIEFKSDSDYAELHLPKNIEDQNYRIKVQGGTEKITKRMADLPARTEEYKEHYSPMYPPRAELEFSVDEEYPPPKPLECNFNVTVNTERSIDGIKFAVSLPQIPPQLTEMGVANSTAAAISMHSCTGANLLESEPTLNLLQLLKWHDDEGQQRELKIIERGSNQWKRIGDLLEIDESTLTDCEENCRYNSARFRRVLQKWLEKRGTRTYKCTWSGLIDVLRDGEHKILAEDLRVALTQSNRKLSNASIQTT